jgi:cyclase
MDRRQALRVLSGTVGTLAAGRWLAMGPALAQDKNKQPARSAFEVAKIELKEIGSNLHLLTGPGGNIAVSIAEDGILLIDSGIPARAADLKEAVAGVSPKPIRLLLNTHWHFDHAGGNEALGKAGALIVASVNCRKRLSTEQTIKALNMTFPPSPKPALPVVTFADATTIYHGGAEIRAIPVAPAHTDTDVLYHFPGANVLHAGDLFFNGFYPFIDVSTKGTIAGMVDAADRLLKLADARTQIIPGHGPLATLGELKTYRDMLASIRDEVKALIDKGKTKADVIAAKPTRAFDEKWDKGFLKGDQFAAIAYDGLTEKD